MRVTRQSWLAEGVLELVLHDPHGVQLPAWEPGAHLTVALANGLRREYSLCGDPRDRSQWTVAVLLDAYSRGGSAFIHRQLRVGDLVEVDGPRNNFPLEPASDYLLIAGGIGITPIKTMAERLAEDDTDYSLLYCGRTRGSMAFLPDMARLAGPRLTVHCDDEQDGPPDLDAVLSARSPGTAVYCCGPAPLLDGVLARVADAHIERFRAAPQPVDAGDAFDVVCTGAGTRVHVPAGVSIVDALERVGVTVPTSCREGICGTCETKVLGGTPDHRDLLLTEDEKRCGQTMLLCVSRSHSPELLLDLT
jgi:ferredoxin-NADP reductase